MPQKKDSSRTSNVDLSYAFATPHRLTICLPEAGEKTILDAPSGDVQL
jgi:hypothetical protein